MQNNRLNLLETSRLNYTPEDGERSLVHYKVERIKFNPNNGQRMSHPELVKTPVKMFPDVKKNLEQQGYSVEIIYHPEGEYNTPINVPEGANSVAREDYEEVKSQAEKALASKDDEILALRERIAAMEAENKALKAEKPVDIEIPDEGVLDLQEGTAETQEGTAETKAKKTNKK